MLTDGQIERRLAPFWRGLNDHSGAWTDRQLVAVARGLPLPAADDLPPDEPTPPDEPSVHRLAVPIASRAPSDASDSSAAPSPSQPTFSIPVTHGAGSALLRGRAKTLASLSITSRNLPGAELVPREMHLPRDPYVDGQRIELFLYKDAAECPICFLYCESAARRRPHDADGTDPPHLNRTRCCDQPICSECFVQIKRPDPHPPEHGDPSAPPRPVAEESEATPPDPDVMLVSEPAACPFCVQPEFGVTYEAPPFRRGLAVLSQSPGHLLGHSLPNATSAMSSSSSLASFSGSGRQLSPVPANRRRTTSLSANAATVITTDRVRPDWASKLASARAHAARRSAAATALHTAAYLMGDRNGSPDTRSFGGFGRRAMRRGASGSESPGAGGGPSHLNLLSALSERYTSDGIGPGSGTSGGESSPTIAGPPRRSSRRNRIDELEDMMMLEAIRLSLVTEEERRKREEKDAAKEAKEKKDEQKKAAKAARKAGLHPSSSHQSLGVWPSPPSDTFPIASGKGKGVARDGRSSDSDLLALPPDPPSSLFDFPKPQPERSQGQPSPTETSYGSPAFRPSHLRNLSNISSSASSIADSVPLGGAHSSFEPSPSSSGINIPRPANGDGFASAAPPAAGTEPTFNFRSLAAMIDHEGRTDGGAGAEHDGSTAQVAGLGGKRSGSTGPDADAGDAPAAVQSIHAPRPAGLAQGPAPKHDVAAGPTGHATAPAVAGTVATELGFKAHEAQILSHGPGRPETGSV
jgi:hypothetical protein